MRPTEAIINLNAVEQNLKLAAKLCGDSVIAVVKANGYGFGLDRLAPLLHDKKEVEKFAVAFSDEGARLRAQLSELSCSKKIITLEGFFSPADLADHRQHKLVPTIHHIEQLRMLQQEKERDYSEPMEVWLKYNSSMNRLGLADAELFEAQDWIRQAKHFKLAGIMTHFASANRSYPKTTLRQIHNFHNALKPVWEKAHSNPKFKFPLVSMCNSAGVVAGFAQDPFAKLGAGATPLEPVERFISRPGLMLYGGSPMDDQSAEEIGIKTAMEFKTRLMAVRKLKEGEAVGYEGSWIAPTPCTMGVIPVGYADGYPFVTPERVHQIPVLVNGKKCHLGGRVSMDMICLDISSCPDAKVGDEVELWGKNLSINEVSDAVRCPAQRLFSAITSRVPRIYR